MFQFEASGSKDAAILAASGYLILTDPGSGWNEDQMFIARSDWLVAR